MDLKRVKVEQLRYDETFIVDAVIWDMDGTLVDSIGAVEAAWGSVAEELGRDRQEVIDLTHGRRAIDNLRDLKPELADVPDPEMDPHVEEFEKKILSNADAYGVEVRSRRESAAESIRSSRRASRVNSQSGSRDISRSNSVGNLAANSSKRKGSFAREVAARMSKLSLTNTNANGVEHRGPSDNSGASSPPSRADLMFTPSDTHAHTNGTTASVVDEPESIVEDDPFEDEVSDGESIDLDSIVVDVSDLKDNSVQIMPSVRRLINCLPDGHWAVATSGAKTYCHGALSRVGITPPPVTITADDKRLKRGKPFPDPFLLAAEELGFDCRNCLIVEDSPSGIRAAVASGAKTIAVATSHPSEKIKDSGAHYLVPDLSCVTFEILPDSRIRVRILPEIAKHTPPRVSGS